MKYSVVRFGRHEVCCAAKVDPADQAAHGLVVPRAGILRVSPMGG